MKDLDGRRLMADSGLEYFKGASTLGALSDNAIRYLLNHGHVLMADAGDTLFKTGDPGSSFLIVLKGRLKYYWQRSGGTVLLREVAFGSQIGYVSMIGLQDREGMAVAAEPSTLLEVSSDLFYQLHLDYPTDFGILMMNLSRDMARVLRNLSARLAEQVSVGEFEV